MGGGGCLKRRCVKIWWRLQHQKKLYKTLRRHFLPANSLESRGTEEHILTFLCCLSLIVQVPPTPTAAPPCRRAPRCLVAAKTACTSAPSRCPAPTSGMKPSTPARAAEHVRLATFSGPSVWLYCTALCLKERRNETDRGI